MWGGTDKSAYSLSLDYTDQGGLVRNSSLQRYSVKLTLDNDATKWLKVGGSIFLNKAIINEADGGSGGLNVPWMVFEAIPILSINYPDRSWGRNRDWPGMEGGENPVRISDQRTQTNKDCGLCQCAKLLPVRQIFRL